MHLEKNSTKKALPAAMPSDDFDFDFKPITSGLGFHQQKTTEVKPAFPETLNTITVTQPIIQNHAPSLRKDQVYQNDLSLFYNRETPAPITMQESLPDKIVRSATRSQRILAYLLDLGLILSTLGIVLTVMSRIIEMDLIEVWSAYPHEITPLVLTLFCGFYLIYFSIFEKTVSSTVGKSLVNIRVVNTDNNTPSFSSLMLRSFVSLANFISLGLFSYFDLQSKISGTRVIKAE